MYFINPINLKKLVKKNNFLTDNEGYEVEILNDHIYLFEKKSNYSDNFGYQWNKFYKTQMDNSNLKFSFDRLKKITNWDFNNLNNKNILEIGSGAGRFTRCILQKTTSNLYSVDFSDAVFANYKNNKEYINLSNLYLIKSSIYSMPLMDNVFDKVICLGVLQHTPNIDESIKNLVKKTKSGGEIIIDFYPLKGWWTKIHAKYLLRPLFKRINHRILLKLIKCYVPFFYYLSVFFNKIGLGLLTRFFPICDIKTLPNVDNIIDWVVLDTFDMLSPEYDQPQKVSTIKNLFIKYRVNVDFSGYIKINNMNCAVVRGTKK